MKKDKKEIETAISVVETTRDIFPTKKPSETIKFASEIAKSVADIVEKRKLYTVIQNKKYVQCEGWTTMGAMLGLFPHIVKVKEERSEKGVKYIATCAIKTADGRVISRAESECASWEKNKQNQEEYAIRSMAETRAVSKAFRICLSWVMTLAGYEPTPAEEITAEIVNGSEKIQVKNVETPQVKTKKEKLFE